MIQEIAPLAIALAIVLGFGLIRLKQHSLIRSNEGTKQNKSVKPDNQSRRRAAKRGRAPKNGGTYLRRIK